MRVFTALCAVACLFSVSAAADTIELKDPKGDDKGPGGYTYPTDTVYKRGSFDLTRVKLVDKGDKVEVTLSVATKIDDPWDSRKWGGHGFSLQMAFVFIDMDHKAGSGYKDALPGLNVQFAEASRWEKVLIISPQGKRRLESEISAKCRKFEGDIVLPLKVRVRGKSIVATYAKKDIGGLSSSWGYQVLMQSNEGYPAKNDFLTRPVNEFHGQHRFGGGNDYSCDPHVLDMLAGKATGDAAEKAAQYKQLQTYTCDDDDEDAGTQATIGMVYPGS